VKAANEDRGQKIVGVIRPGVGRAEELLLRRRVHEFAELFYLGRDVVVDVLEKALVGEEVHLIL
jgi:hypothetical protein